MQRIKKIKHLLIIITTTCLNLTCGDMYNDIWDNSVSDNYRLGFIEVSSIFGARYLKITPEGKLYDSGWNIPSGNFNSISIDDFNCDGRLDMLIINQGGNPVICYNTGTGSFGSPLTLPVLTNGFKADTGDFNNDGLTDIVIASKNNTFTFIGNSGTGLFNIIQDTTPPNDLRSITSGDYDGNGKKDVVIGDFQGNVYLLKNQYIQSSNFLANTLIIHSFTPASAIQDIKTVDIDNDGDLDLFVLSDSNQYCVLFNNGNGVFTPGVLTGITGPTNSAFADFDDDGDLDICVSTAAGENNKILINNGYGVFAERSLPGSVTDNSTAIKAGDIDLDGDMDIIVSSDTGTYILTNHGAGNFTLSDKFTALSDITSSAVGVFN